jgi:hypothetical protein
MRDLVRQVVVALDITHFCRKGVFALERSFPTTFTRKTPMVIGYDDLLSFVQLMLPLLRLTQQRNLAWTVLGILRVRDAHLTISEIARAMTSRSHHWHKFKRLWRFLSNTRWSPVACSAALLRFLLSRWHIGQYLPLIIDQSTIAGRWEVLWASVPFRGRALPLYFQLFRATDINAVADGSQNKLEEQFVSALLTLIPATIRPLLLFDRGYARVTLMQLLQACQVHYVIRVCKETWVRYHRYQGPLAAVKVRRGELLWWPRARYQLKTAYLVNIAISLNATAEEPWYLVTNLRRADSTVSWYERRFHCEELFRDVKDQLHLETIRTQKRERIERLLFAVVVAYYALTLIGLAAQRAGHRPHVCRYRVSAPWLALRLLFMPHLLKPRMLRRALLIYSWSLSYRESG